MDKVILYIHDNLESIKKISSDERQMEFWSARDLMKILGYAKWQKFADVIERAKQAAQVSDNTIENHFLPAPVKSTGGRPGDDYFLTRYACYLIA